MLANDQFLSPLNEYGPTNMEWTLVVLSNQHLGSTEAIYMANAEMLNYAEGLNYLEFRC